MLEIGTLGGYSTIWLARALPGDGRVVTLEVDPRHAAVARANLDRAGLGEHVEIVEGPAAASLARLVQERHPPFDFVFIDADKATNPTYLDFALRLSRPGSVIVADNVVRNGAVADGSSDEPNVRGIRRFVELCADDPRLDATAIQTVGTKGYDGFLIAVVRRDRCWRPSPTLLDVISLRWRWFCPLSCSKAATSCSVRWSNATHRCSLSRPANRVCTTGTVTFPTAATPRSST